MSRAAHFLVGALACAVQLAAQDAEAERQLAVVERSLDAGDHRIAERIVRVLAARLDEKGTIDVYRERLVRAFARARFAPHYDEPKTGALLAGLVRVDTASKTLGFRLDGALSAGGHSDATPNGRSHWIHPVAFTGTRIEATLDVATQSSRAPVELVLGIGDAGAVRVIFGAREPSSGQGFRGKVAVVGTDGSETVLAQVAGEQLPAIGAPHELGVRCVGGRIEMRIDGKVVATARTKPERLAGRWGVGRSAQPTRVTIEGQADLGILAVREAELRAEAFARWIATADLVSALPEELLPRLPGERRASVGSSPGAAPGGSAPQSLRTAVEDGSIERWQRVGELLQAGRPEAALQACDEAGATDPVGLLFAVRACLDLGRIGEAAQRLAVLDGALGRRGGVDSGRADEHWEVAMIRGRVRASQGALDEALAAFDVAARNERARDAARRDALRACLRVGAHDEALQRYRAVGDDPVFELFEPTMRRIRSRGPSFARLVEHRTRHYEIRTDVDRATAVAVGEALETALDRLRAHYGARVRLPDGRLRVHVFGTRGGYASYARELAGGAPIPPHTDGLYSRNTKELLLRATGDLPRLLRTARHEGFHQFLDAATGGVSAPSWFEEGSAQLAERSAAERRDRGSAGWARERDRFVPLAEFVGFGAARFYRDDPGRNYAQAEALMTFLRSGDPAARAVENALVRALVERTHEGAAATRAAVTGSAGWESLQQRFQRFLRR